MNYLNKYNKYVSKLNNQTAGSSKYDSLNESELKLEFQKKSLNWDLVLGLDKPAIIKILVEMDEDAASKGEGGGGASVALASASVASVRPKNLSEIRRYSTTTERQVAATNASIKEIVTIPLKEFMVEKLIPWLYMTKSKKSIMFIGESHIGTSIKNRNETIAKQIHLITETIKQNSQKKIAVLTEIDPISINGIVLFEYVPDANRPNIFFIKHYLDSISTTLFKINPVTTDQRTVTGGDRLYINEIYRLLNTHDIVIFIVGLGHLPKLQEITEQDQRGFNYVCINSGSKDDILIVIKEWFRISPTNMFDYFNLLYPYYDGTTLVPMISSVLNIPVKPKDATYHQLFIKYNTEQTAALNEQKRKAGEGGGGGGANDLD